MPNDEGVARDNGGQPEIRVIRGDYIATVMGYVDGIKAAKIPRTIEKSGIEYKVTSLRAGCFENCSSLTIVTIPETVTRLPERCFYGCINLSSLTLPNTIKTIIGYECFKSVGTEAKPCKLYIT